MKRVTQEISLAGRTLTLSTGDIAGLATSSVLARYGDTMILATVSTRKLESDPGFMPLTVEYVERLYAGGKIKGSRWVKREGRPSDEAILVARLVDRCLRPLFPKDFRDEVQVVLTVLSVDGENDPNVLSAVAASAALAISPLPWNGPVAVMRLGMQDGTFFVNPTDSEMAFSNLDLVVSLKKSPDGFSILMIEAGANQVPEEKIIEALTSASAPAATLIEGILEFAQKAGTVKQKPAPPRHDTTLLTKIDQNYRKEIDRFFGGSYCGDKLYK